MWHVFYIWRVSSYSDYLGRTLSLGLNKHIFESVFFCLRSIFQQKSLAQTPQTSYFRHSWVPRFLWQIPPFKHRLSGQEDDIESGALSAVLPVSEASSSSSILIKSGQTSFRSIRDWAQPGCWTYCSYQMKAEVRAILAEKHLAPTPEEEKVTPF